jgi:hypothetical protein
MSQQINLLNPALLQTKKFLAAADMAHVLGVVLLGVAGLSLYGHHRLGLLLQQADAGLARLEKRKADLASTNREFAPRRKSAAVEAQLAQAEAQLAALHRISGVLERGELGNTQGYSEFFRALARQSVDGLWLTGLTLDGASNEISVRGRALDPSLLPGYLARLTQETVLQGKAFGRLRLEQAAPVTAVGKDGKETSVPAPYIEFSLEATAEEARP